MEWKGSENTGSVEQESDGEIYEDEDYPIWQKPKKRSISERFFKKIEIPSVVLGAGLVILIVLIIVSISGKTDSNLDNQVVSIENRLSQIEDRLNNIELNSGSSKQIEGQNSKFVEFNDKISRLEASIALRLDQISTDIGRVRRASPAGAVSKPSVKKPTSTLAGQKTPSMRYHQVRSGETLYSIGKRYDLKVGELLRLNKLKRSSVIYPGQKLIVGK